MAKPKGNRVDKPSKSNSEKSQAVDAASKNGGATQPKRVSARMALKRKATKQITGKERTNPEF